MISLSSEMTDTKGSRAANGWVFFDRECGICTRLAHRFRGVFAKRGFGLAALQDPRAASLLAIPPEEMLREMRVVTTKGVVYGGANAVVFLAGRIWWAWPLYFAGRLPVCGRLLDAGYRWFAARRRCSSQGCKSAAANRQQDFTAEMKGDTK
jgi:predicted DCC family thiol-disulfide oxidoreductase YuxK